MKQESRLIRLGYKRKQKSKEKNRIKTLAQWQDPDFISKQMKARSKRPNKPEKKLNKILNKLFPNEWKYVGNFKVVIGGKCPDFVNINGQKKLIELFGDYWHSEKITGISEEQHEQKRVEHFSEYGYKTLIIWENELKNMGTITQKINNFVKEI